MDCRSLGLFAGIAASAWIGASPAGACSYSPISVRLASESVPQNGPVLIEVSCQETDFCETETIDSVAVTRNGMPVPGAFETMRGDFGAFLVWRPSAQLEAGETYTVTVSDEALAADVGPEGWPAFELRVDQDFHWSEPTTPSFRFGSSAEDTGERFCCFAAQACFDHCFTEARIIKASLAPELPTDFGKSGLLYALRWTEADGRAQRRGLRQYVRFSSYEPTHLDLRAEFEQPAERYCATLEVHSLITGETRDLTHCEKADPSVEYGARVEPMFDPSSLLDCQGPPGMEYACDPTAGPCELKSSVLHSAWCEINRARCESDGGRGRWIGLCEDYTALCSGLPGNTAAEPVPETAAGLAPAAPDIAQQGCSAASGNPAAPLTGYALLGAIALAFRRRAI